MTHILRDFILLPASPDPDPDPGPGPGPGPGPRRSKKDFQDKFAGYGINRFQNLPTKKERK